MAPALQDLWRRDEPEFPSHAKEPIGGIVVTVIISLVSTTILSVFLTQRSLAIKVWTRLPLVAWLVFAIYIDSYSFVFATAILQLAFGVNTNLGLCQGAILLCLICYVTTKFIYLFLVEKAHIIRGCTKPRLKSKLYIFNSFGMIGVYAVVCVLNFVFRITRIENGQCIIGMRNVAMIPLISFDFLVNVYLTILFLIPLKNLYSFKNVQKTPARVRLRSVAMRTFAGAVATLASSIVNLSVLMALNGEPGWVCLMCCNCDILFSAVVIQWVTSKDNAGTTGSTNNNETAPTSRPGGGGGGGTIGKDTSGLRLPSPVLSPSNKGALDDIGDISLLDSSTELGPSSSASCSDKGSSVVRVGGKLPSAGEVIVTTTIKRESRPSGVMFDEMGIEDSGSAVGGNGRRAARPLSGAVGLRDGFMRVSRPRITGGMHD